MRFTHIVYIALVILGVLVLLVLAIVALYRTGMKASREEIKQLTGEDYTGPMDRVWEVFGHHGNTHGHQYPLGMLIRASKRQVNFTDPGNILVVIEHMGVGDGKTFRIGNVSGKPTAKIVETTLVEDAGFIIRMVKGDQTFTATGTGSDLVQQVLSFIN